jgi:hypothetical protein
MTRASVQLCKAHLLTAFALSSMFFVGLSDSAQAQQELSFLNEQLDLTLGPPKPVDQRTCGSQPEEAEGNVRSGLASVPWTVQD